LETTMGNYNALAFTRQQLTGRGESLGEWALALKGYRSWNALWSLLPTLLSRGPVALKENMTSTHCLLPSNRQEPKLRASIQHQQNSSTKYRPKSCRHICHAIQRLHPPCASCTLSNSSVAHEYQCGALPPIHISSACVATPKRTADGMMYGTYLKIRPDSLSRELGV
jgi:hypothetical protein